MVFLRWNLGWFLNFYIGFQFWIHVYNRVSISQNTGSQLSKLAFKKIQVRSLYYTYWTESCSVDTQCYIDNVYYLKEMEGQLSPPIESLSPTETLSGWGGLKYSFLPPTDSPSPSLSPHPLSSDTLTLILPTDTLKLRRWEGEFTPRYEHGAVLHEGELLVFGGADTRGNRDDLQALKVDGNICLV